MHTCASCDATGQPHAHARHGPHAANVRASLPRADEFQREVLCEQMAVAEEDDQVDLELDLSKVRRSKWCGGGGGN